MAGIYSRGVADAEEAEHSHNIPVHQPFSLAHTYDHSAAQLDDSEETAEQRSARLAGYYARGTVAAEEAEHGHTIPVHKKSTLAYTYDHVKTQLDSNLGYEWGKFNDGVGEPDHVPKETNKSTSPLERAFTPKDTEESRKLATDNEHTRVVPLPEGTLVGQDSDDCEPAHIAC